MKISRRSWHYRLYNFYRNWWYNFFGFGWILDLIRDHTKPHFRSYPVPHSLCPYFWKVVLLTLAFPLGCCVSLFTLSTMSITFLICSPFAFAYRGIRNSYRPLKSKSYKYKEPGLIKSFVAAKKSKVCPPLTLVD